MKIARTALILGLALLAACSEKTPEARQTPSPTQSTASPTPSASIARQIAYVTTEVDGTRASTQSDLWLYDVAADAVTRLTTDGKRHQESLPRFHGSLVGYVEDGKKLVEIDPATKSRKTVLSVRGAILAHAWRGDEVAYIENDANGTHRLRVRNTVTGTTRMLKTLGTPVGRGTGLDDVLSIEWSRTGAQLLITDTHVDEEPTVRILRRDGSDLTEPIRNATNALWSLDERSIYFRDTSLHGGSFPNGRWERRDLVGGEGEALGLDGAAHHAMLSPDGKRLAAVKFDRPDGPHVMEILDLSTGTTSRGPTGARDPVWISADSFAATKVTGCAGNDDACLYFGFRGAGTRLYQLDGTSKSIALGTTLWNGLGGVNTDVRFA